MKQLGKIIGGAALGFFWVGLAYAHNCGSLSDCFNTIKSATVAAVGVAVMVVVGMLTDLFKMGEAEAGEAPQEGKTETWDPVTNESIGKLDKSIRQNVINFINKVGKDLEIRLRIRVSDSYRTNEQQDELYKIGRQEIEGEKTVTDAKAGESYHNYGLAFDVYEIKDNKINEEVDMKKVAEIAKEKEFGFEWGGEWSKPDKPHFQKPTEEVKKKIEEMKKKNEEKEAEEEKKAKSKAETNDATS